ncbi:MAG: tRNA 4-thiouridine(8) synthase ThiI [Proteobacteria bacterium]|nr:tRNA 4-thiouridine(8) synthase ThiI [Pseudomonadota bacterium]
MQYRIIVQFAELALKGKNRHRFIKRLRKNIADKLKIMGFDWPVKAIHDRIYVHLPGDDTIEEQTARGVVKELARLPGIAWLSFVYWFSEQQFNFLSQQADLTLIHNLVKRIAKEQYKPNQSFAVRVKRRDKQFSTSSQDFEQQIATTILQNSQWQRVNLTKPDQTFYVDIASDGISVHSDKILGVGGLPVGSTGQVLTLLSGGFDSPVAAWLMAKRGCQTDFIHFTASHQPLEDIEQDKIVRTAKIVSESSGYVRLYKVPYTYFDMALMELDLDYDLILFRRFMARVAAQLMPEVEGQALVTGDNLGQVASQTLENMESMNKSTDAMILRPLLSYNKHDIIALSADLGLFDVCREPHKDCCALISKNPRTKSRSYVLENMEQEHLSDYQSLIDSTLNDAVILTFYFGRLVDKQKVHKV